MGLGLYSSMVLGMYNIDHVPHPHKLPNMLSAVCVYIQLDALL